MPMGLPVWTHMDFVLPAVRQVAVFLKRLAGIYRPVTADYAAMLFISNFIRRTFMIDMDRWTCIHLKRKYSEGFGKSVQSCCLALRNTKNAGANQQPYQGYIQYAPCLSGCGPRSVPCKRYHAAYPLR